MSQIPLPDAMRLDMMSTHSSTSVRNSLSPFACAVSLLYLSFCCFCFSLLRVFVLNFLARSLAPLFISVLQHVHHHRLLSATQHIWVRAVSRGPLFGRASLFGLHRRDHIQQYCRRSCSKLQAQLQGQQQWFRRNIRLQYRLPKATATRPTANKLRRSRCIALPSSTLHGSVVLPLRVIEVRISLFDSLT